MDSQKKKTIFGDNHRSASDLMILMGKKARFPNALMRLCVGETVLADFLFYKRDKERHKAAKEKNQVHEQFHSINNTNLAYSWLQDERGHAGVWVSARGQPERV